MNKWDKKFIIMLIALGIIAFFIGPIRFLFVDTTQLQAESLDRAGSLVRLLAASNQEAFSQEQEVLYTTDAVRGELGVEEAFITDNQGMVLAPAEYFGMQAQKIKDFRNFYLEKAGDNLRAYDLGKNHYFLTYPIFNSLETYRGIQEIKKGVAYISYNTSASLNRVHVRYLEAIRFLVLMILCLWGLFYLQKRWTLSYVDEATKNAVKESEKNETTAPESHNLTANFWEKLEQLGLGTYLVLDDKRAIVSHQGAVEKKLKCSLEKGGHLLECLSDSPYFQDMLDAVVALGKEPTNYDATSTDGALKIKGTSVEGEGARAYYLIALD
jgi:hypothetical protein